MTGIEGGGDLAMQRGIVDRASGREIARRALRSMCQQAAEALGPKPVLDDITLAMFGTLTRLQAQHEGAARELAADNPFAAASCLRSLAEVVALICYLLEKPTEVRRISMHASNQDRFKIGVLVRAAGREAPGFAEVYQQLSNFAHPSFVGATTAMTVADDGHFTWQSAPKFKNEDDARSMYLWLLELTEAAGPLWCRLHLRVRTSHGDSSRQPGPT